MNIEHIIAVLRDTAEKASEEVVSTRKSKHPMRDWEEVDVEYRAEKYSKEWIAGRLHGIADAMETLTKENV